MARLTSTIRIVADELLFRLTPTPPQLRSLADAMRGAPAPYGPRLPNPFARRLR